MQEKFKSSIAIGIAVVLAAYVLGSAFKKRNESQDTISVVGLGSKDFVSDEILWSGSFTTKSFEIKEAYSKIISDQKIVEQFFLSKGLKELNFLLEQSNLIKNLEKFAFKGRIIMILNMSKFLTVTKQFKQ